MKKIIITLLLGVALCISGALMAQPLPNENGNGSPTGGNPISGAGAPIGGGVEILITLGIAYGIRRYNLAKKTE